MKINDIITEQTKSEVPDHQKGALRGATIFRDIGGFDRTHHLYRIMMAAAMSDGSNDKPQDMDALTWHSKYNVAVPYSDAEHMMMKSAMNTIGADSQEVITDRRSKETDDTHKVSPVRSRVAKK